jgi:TRAP-type C4-dicarboxylate transport system substrate-binding protein
MLSLMVFFRPKMIFELYRLAGAVLIIALASLGAGRHAAAQPSVIELDVIGGLAGVSQYERFEEPFWSTTVPIITGGRVRAHVVPVERSGVRGQDVLQLLRLGVVPFGNVLLALAASEEPELNGIDLPLLNPNIQALRQTAEIWRPRLTALLEERYGVKLLAIYTYPAQVMFCREAFSGLSDLAGRRVRTSSVGQSELVSALGGIPVVIPFSEIVSAMRRGVVQCAITGSKSGNSIGLHEVSTHISRLGISWGVSIFAANLTYWEALPVDVQQQLLPGIERLQQDIWAASDQETRDGFNCNAGHATCVGGRPGNMTIVGENAQDNVRRISLLTDTVVRNWVKRCGAECELSWNSLMSSATGVRAKGPFNDK